MPAKLATASRLHLALERVSSIFRAQLRQVATAHDLKLVQLEALIYFGVANRYSDTAAGFGEYLGITKGTVSQTLRALERRELIARVADVDDKRVMHCELTAEGKSIAALAQPAEMLVGLDARAQKQSVDAAGVLLSAIQSGARFASFGHCQTCSHFQANGKRLHCGLTQEPIRTADALLICREHQWPTSTSTS